MDLNKTKDSERSRIYLSFIYVEPKLLICTDLLETLEVILMIKR